MENLTSIWNGLSLSRKLTLGGVLAATLIAFYFMISAASKPTMAFLYGGLDGAAAGEILDALESMDVTAEVRGDAIYVPSNQRDQARMDLASQGLPKQGQPGFELLDAMNGFATTSDMFDAAYWRAKEGELARTILASPGVKSARVHLAAPKSSAFSRNRRPPSGSVTVSMGGRPLKVKQATAMRFLIALAVPGLAPEQVAVIDAENGIILKPGAEDEMMAGGDEADRIKRLERSIASLLEARVGPGNARVTVSMEIDREREMVSERRLDPESRVLMNRDATDMAQSDQGQVGAVTVASNLPEGDAGQGNSSSSQRNETSETLRYDISEVNRQREKMPGAVARINVAVLINDVVEVAGADADPADASLGRDEEELNALRDLVAAAIGYDAARGDVVTVKSMPFHSVTTDLGEEAVSGGAVDVLMNNLPMILQIAIPSLVVLILSLFVIKPILTAKPTEAEPLAELGDFSAPEMEEEPEIEMNMAMASFDDEPMIGLEDKSPVDELRDLAAGNTEATTKILTSWLGDTVEAA